MTKGLWRWTPGMVLGIVIAMAVTVGCFAMLTRTKGSLAWGEGIVGALAAVYLLLTWGHVNNSDGESKYHLPVSAWVVRALCYTAGFLYFFLTALSLLPRLVS